MEPEQGMTAFLKRQIELLKIERDEEVLEFNLVSSDRASLALMEAAGIALTRLDLSGIELGVAGKTILILQPRGARILNQGKLTPGDPVTIRCTISSDALSSSSNSTPSPESCSKSGVLLNISSTNLRVSLDHQNDISSKDSDDIFRDYNASFALFKMGNDATFKRSVKALEEVSRITTSHPAWRLRQVLLENEKPRFSDRLNQRHEAVSYDQLVAQVDSKIAHLNDSQRHAIWHCLTAEDVSCIHGPPGTGKTTTVVALIDAALALGDRILVCAPSNIAVDNIIERLARFPVKPNMVRIGHPARLLPTVIEYSLDVLYSKTDEAGLVNDIRKEIVDIDKKFKTSDAASTSSKKKMTKNDRKSLYSERKYLQKELRTRERNSIAQFVSSCQLVLATTAGAGSSILDDTSQINKGFDLVIIDEAAQATEAASWIPILRGRRLVLAGDPCQLPPTVKSDQAEKGGLAVTLMDRIFRNQFMREKAVKMLDTQYRMNQVISDWSSGAMYENKLKSHPSVAQHLLKDVTGIEQDENTTVPLVFIDTAGCDCDEATADPDDASKSKTKYSQFLVKETKFNIAEADIVKEHVKNIVRAGVAPHEIAVISPYAGQVEHLKGLLSPEMTKGLEISTVDGFQGREKDVVVISLVRSNSSQEVGFLSDHRRINVAVTRARKHACVIGDTDTINSDSFLKEFVEYVESSGEYRSAGEYGDVSFRTFSTQNTFVMRDNSTDQSEKDVRLAVKGSAVSKEAPKKTKLSKSKQATKTSSQPSKEKINVQNEKDRTSALNEEQSERFFTLQKELEEFKKSSVNGAGKEFPSTLDAYERKMIHKISEKLELIHESKGTGSDRHIVVSVPGNLVEKKVSRAAVVSQECAHEIKNHIPKEYLERQKLKFDTGQKIQATVHNKPQKSVLKKNNKPQKSVLKKNQAESSNKTNTAKNIQADEEEDLDALLEEFRKNDLDQKEVKPWDKYTLSVSDTGPWGAKARQQKAMLSNKLESKIKEAEKNRTRQSKKK